MRLRLLRHATLTLDYAGRHLLVDPMLGDAASVDPVQNSPNPRRNPLVPLPISATEVVRSGDAVLVTHTHRDHWDTAAAELIAKNVPLFGQPEDQPKFSAQGFTKTTSVQPVASWEGIAVARTGGQHGTGEMGRRMAPVSGFVLQAPGEPTLYIAGDTIWCDEVKHALDHYHPDFIVVNAGAARFLEGDPITMSAEDVIQVCRAAPHAQVVAVHMEAFNHCLLTRDDLRFQLEAERLLDRVQIPADGEVLDQPSLVK